MLHIAKLAVGVRDVAHLRDIQARRALIEPPLRHRTRNLPRRAAEIVDGGSLFWVVAGTMLVRQRILDVRPDIWDDRSRCAALILDPALVALTPRPIRPFQGWRYLAPDAAPADLDSSRDADHVAMPEPLRRALQELCLL